MPRECDVFGGMTVRPAGSADADAIVSLVRTAFARQPVCVNPPPSALSETTQRVLRHLAAPGGGGLVAEVGDLVVACCLWSVSDGVMRLTRLAVEPRLRRRGLALCLLGHAEATAREVGLERLGLSTRVALIGNRQLFKKAGFRDIALRAHEGFAEPTFVEMELRL